MSELEYEFLRLWGDENPPIQNYRFIVEEGIVEGGAGVRARMRESEYSDWRMDFAWPDAKVYVEIDGLGGVGGSVGGHRTITGFLRDIRKHNAATVHGWRLYRVTTLDIRGNIRTQQKMLNTIRSLIGLQPISIEETDFVRKINQAIEESV